MLSLSVEFEGVRVSLSPSNRRYLKVYLQSFVVRLNSSSMWLIWL
ncbi:MAG: hypothetical protein ACTS6H_00610 [Candidatus Hodgkinia cicadicola]